MMKSGQWYHFALEVDVAENKYISLTVNGDGVDETIDLSGYNIAEEIRFRENAFWLTLESENIWNNCGTAGNNDFEVHYDDAMLLSISVSEPSTAALLLIAAVGMTSFSRLRENSATQLL